MPPRAPGGWTGGAAIAGYVYALRSEISCFVKIGMTVAAPMMRLRGIIGTPHYAAVGPWHIVECRAVLDAEAEERALHRRFEAARVTSVPRAKELFDIDLADALAALQEIPPERCLDGPRLSQFREDHDLRVYLAALFRVSGREHFADIQGAWTLSLYPSTMGGRYFTLNIDRHEVAFSTLAKADRPAVHMLVTDALVQRYGGGDELGGGPEWRAPSIALCIRQGLRASPYASGKEGSVAVHWAGSIADAVAILDQPGVRRALLAYWYDMLLPMGERGKRSLHARRHDHNAASDLFADMREQGRRNLCASHNPLCAPAP